MRLSAILGPLLDAKADHELIRKMILAHEDAQADKLEQRRETDRKRQAAKAERDRLSRESRERDDGGSSHVGVARGEDNLLPKKISGKKENKNAATLSDLAAFKADLETDCSPEQVDSFAKHRKAKNGQNSAYAAKLFRRDAAACGLSPSQAIDVAVSRGWLTVKPEYLRGRPNSTAPPDKPPPRPRNVGELSHEQLLAPRTEIDVTDYSTRRLEAGNGRGLPAGSGDAKAFTVSGDFLGRI